MLSKEFIIDGNRYLLESSCNPVIWSTVCDRVERHLIRVGSEAAKNQFGSPQVEGNTKLGKELISFKLTLNPTGNNFR